MAAHVEEGAAASRLAVPEVGGVRTGVTLAGAHRQHATHRPGRDHLMDLDDLGREDLVLEVPVEDAGLANEPQHLRGLGRVPAERLRAQHALARRDRGPDGLEVEVVGQRDDDEVDAGIGAQLGHRVIGPVDPVAPREVGAAAAPPVEALATTRASGTKASPAR